MRLTQIKLAGFKSFTDPTTIHVPSQLVAVIGPNGCGKSNVIDAVRWVLGEASAKQLRGESMQDVIFNGAATRRPAPRASVELVFDNSDHALQGAWGQYAEVSIKRQLTRQGDSSYFINGQAVRRRDITDLFLGTGVGARGYAVIEQGMISRIIEARPEELRAYIEEAAGVSKYKERRRETESRLNDTREHLQRLADLQTELSRQVEKLEKQASTAEKYRQLNQELAQQQNLQDYVHWQQALADADKAAEQHQIAQTQQEQLSTQTEQLNQHIQTLRTQEQEQQNTVGSLKNQHALLREQMARVEEQIRAQQTYQQRTEKERAAAQNKIHHLQQQHNSILEECDVLQNRLLDKQTELAELAMVVAEHEMRLPELERLEQQQHHAYTSQQEQLNQLKRELALKQQQAQHTQQALAKHHERAARLREELTALALPDDAELAAAQLASETHQVQYEATEIALQQQTDTIGSLKTRWQTAQQHLSVIQQQVMTAQAQQQALAQILHSQQTTDVWAETTFADAPVLWQHVHAPDAWQMALSVVLAERVQARCLPEPMQGQPENLAHGTAAWINTQGSLKHKTLPAQALLNQIQVDKRFQAAVSHWLDGVLCAPDLAYALAHQHDLQGHQIWLTPEGHRVDKVGVILFAANDGVDFLQHQAKYDALTQDLAQLEPQLATAEHAYQQIQQEMTAAEQAHQQMLAQHRQTSAAWQEAQHQANTLFTRTNQGQLRREHIVLELAQLDEECAVLAQQQETLATDGETLAQAVAELDTQNRELSGNRHTQQQALKQAQLALLEANRQYGVAELDIHKWQQRVDSLQAQAAALVQQQADWQTRLEETVFQAADDALMEELSQQLAHHQEHEMVLQEQISAAESHLQETQTQGMEVYERVQVAAAMLPQIQAAVQTALLQQQEALLNAQRYHEDLLARDADLAYLSQYEYSGSLKDLAQHIKQLQTQIDALGAVNLAALAELSEAHERDEYYRQQSEDVQAAIDLLEQAIAQIDDETKIRFKETFDAVNAKVQEFFPTLFGGGEARLHMVGDDLLTAGVSIMARPVGKKNATIHLLSGGEKALTAMSLVFALFSLNPAPFCLLDEVDAPLDDANTSRFCQLVKEMSAQTQFLYISHNRLTMEMAEQLVGVTMQEKGVSRVVAVDIQQALQMAEQ
ncbi:chromosome segregation protein SMC [Wielerella bovis]|uniref:chromosome segregation protein SMC n=1 Tax=Wielerella bovis TaxID=2917790 RepID=UPI00201896FF|nr:chromosome segregation protein SMC [Wielerella bovis]MCG7657488.1 chromosome segregation protein SMC [Wielerella bovis]MCG7659709.1 chromosome segregation protein SMC [Wielerella bovis]